MLSGGRNEGRSRREGGLKHERRLYFKKKEKRDSTVHNLITILNCRKERNEKKEKGRLIAVPRARAKRKVSFRAPRTNTDMTRSQLLGPRQTTNFVSFYLLLLLLTVSSPKLFRMKMQITIRLK